MSICFICSGTNADEAIANCHKDNVETERSWYLQEWPNEVQCKRQGRQRQHQCHCQLNSVKELSLCYLQSCRSCVGSLVWLPLCKDIAVATCWSGASTKLCQTVIAFLWLTFNCCGSALVGLGCTTLQPPYPLSILHSPSHFLYMWLCVRKELRRSNVKCCHTHV